MQSRDRWTEARVARRLAAAVALTAATSVAAACHHTATPAATGGDSTATAVAAPDTTAAATTTTTTTTTTTSSSTSSSTNPPAAAPPTAAPPTAAPPTDTANRGAASSSSSGASTSSAGAPQQAASANGAPADSSCTKVNGAAGAQPQKPGADPLAVNQSEYDGWKMFHVYCYRCHGTDALGSDIAPNLRHSVGPEGTVDHACFIYTVTHGRPAKGMPTWAALLERSQMENIYHYLLARSSGRLEPGRPHVAGTSSSGSGH